jgi:hypothetical protein
MQFDAVRCNAPLTVQEVKEEDAANRGCPREGAVRVTHWTFRREKASLREFHRPAMLGATRVQPKSGNSTIIAVARLLGSPTIR